MNTSDCPTIKHNGLSKLVAVSLRFLVTGALCIGCHKQTATDNATHINTEAAPRTIDYYEGTWLCSGYVTEDGATVSFSDMTAEEAKTFPFIILEIEDDTAQILQYENESGRIRFILLADSVKITTNGIKVGGAGNGYDVLYGNPEGTTFAGNGSAEFLLDREMLSAAYGNRTVYFEHFGFKGDLQVSRIAFEDIAFDVPIDLAFAYYSEISDEQDYAHSESWRRYGPGLYISSQEIDIDNIVELVAEREGRDYCVNHPDYFHQLEDVYIYTPPSFENGEDAHVYNVEFVKNGKFYRIEFTCHDRDSVDYLTYPETFYTTFDFDNVTTADTGITGTVNGNTEQHDIISWQDAYRYVGERVTVCGPVVSAEYASTSNGQPTFIDLGASYPDRNRVTLVIWGSDRSEFPEAPERLFSGESIAVSGEIYLYEGVCNIVVTAPSQIQVL